MEARRWLRSNGYTDIAELIDAIMDRWKIAGAKTRRNWWDILAGDKNGHPRVAGGVQFPVLRAAQIRQGRRCRDGMCRNPEEVAPEKKATNRWPGRPAH